VRFERLDDHALSAGSYRPVAIRILPRLSRALSRLGVTDSDTVPYCYIVQVYIDMVTI